MRSDGWHNRGFETGPRSLPANAGATYHQKSHLPSMSALWDYENWLLSKYNVELGVSVGLERLTHEHWIRHVKNDLPNSDWTWDHYVQHVEAGDGDDWFFESRSEDVAQ